MNKFFLISFVLLVSLSISSVIASDVAYVLRDPEAPENNFISAIENLGLSYELIDDYDIITTDFEDYEMILLGEGPLENYESLPITERKSLVANTYYLRTWGIAKYAGSSISTGYASAQILIDNIITYGLPNPFQVYGVREVTLYNLPYAYRRAPGLENIVSTDNYHMYPVVGTIPTGGELYEGKGYADERTAFFGITDSDQWTLESQELFENTIEWVLYGGDDDWDYIKNDFDNCVDDYNPYQEDSDGDGIGDVCDSCIFDENNDIDNDGVCGDIDNCVDVINANQDDFDFDGFGDVCDDDIDGDGVDNIFDFCVETSLAENANVYGCAGYQMIIINEFESNPKEGSEWVELYNPTDSDVDISYLEVWEGLSSPKRVHLIPQNTIIEGEDYYVFEVSGLNNDGEFLTLYDFFDNKIDETSILSDGNGDVKTWQRKPNGIDTDSVSDWSFQTPTKGMSNDADVDTPILNPIGDKEVDENSLLEFSVSGVDFGDEFITLSVVSLPSGANFNAISDNGYIEQTFSWTPTYEQSGEYEIEFVLSDGTLEDRKNVTIIVNNVNRAPVLGLITDQIMDEDCDPIEMTLTAIDYDNDALSFSIIGENVDEVDCNIEGDKITIDGADDWAGDATCTVQVSDGDLTDEQTFNIHVNDLNDGPRIDSYSPSGPIVLMENTDELFSVSASDVEGSSLTITWFLDDVEVESGTSYIFNQPKGNYIVKAEISDGVDSISQIWDVSVGDISYFTCSEVNGFIIPDNEVCMGDILETSDSNELTCCSILGSPSFSDAKRCSEIDNRLIVSINDPDSGDEFMVGETIDVEIEVENLFDEDLDFDLEVYFYDLTKDKDEENYDDDLDVDEDEEEKIEFSFDIPEDLEDSHTYAIFVRVLEEDGKYCNEAYNIIDIEREDNYVVVEDINMEEVVNCGDSVYIETKIKNLGSEDQDVYVSVENSVLGIKETSEEFELEEYDEDDDVVKYFDINIPQDTETGVYDLTFTTFFDDGGEKNSIIKSFVVECKEIDVKTEGLENIMLDSKNEPVQIKSNTRMLVLISVLGLLVLVFLIILLVLMRIF